MNRKCRNPLSSDELFQLYRSATGADRELLQDQLIRSLQKHASSVCYLRLKESRPEISNAAIQKALINSRTFEGRNNAKFSSWFQQIVENLIRNEFRKKSADREVFLDDLSVDELNSVTLVEQSPNAKIMVGQLMELATIEQRELMRLKLEGLTLKEIAEVKKIPCTTVEKRWEQLRRVLRRKCDRNAFI